MDTATLIAVDTVLAARSLRGAARALERPVSSIAAALARFETEVSIRLAERSGVSLALSLEALRMAADVAEAARLSRLVSPVAAVRLEALDRFAEVANAGSIRRAAHLLGVGQPQLSRQMTNLEAVIGQPLLDRSRGAARITPQGLRLRDIIVDLQIVWRKLSGASEERFRKTQATANLGSIMPLGYESEIAQQLAHVAARWLAERPRAPLFVSAGTAEDLLAGARSGEFDAVYLDIDVLPADLAGVRLRQSPLALVGGQADGDLVTRLLRAPLVVPSARSGLRQKIDTLLDEVLSSGERRQLRLIEIDSIPVIVNLVLDYGFVSVLPVASLVRMKPDIASTILPERYAMNLWVCWPDGPEEEAVGRTILRFMQELA